MTKQNNIAQMNSPGGRNGRPALQESWLCRAYRVDCLDSLDTVNWRQGNKKEMTARLEKRRDWGAR